MRVALGGGNPEVIAENMSPAEALAVDDSYAYFFVDVANGNQALFRVPEDGSASPQQMNVSASSFSGALLTAGGTLYWQNNRAINALAVDGSSAVRQVSVSDDYPAAVPSELALDHDVLYWISQPAPPNGFGIESISTSGRDGRSLARVEGKQGNSPLGIAVDDTYVYCSYEAGEAGADGNPWRVDRIDKQSGNRVALLVDPSLVFALLAVTDTALYVVAPGEQLSQIPPQHAKGVVLRVPK
jgi:hypothetical protein